MVKELTFNGKLKACRCDWMNYITYVFENLDYADPTLRYIMCTQFPNWNQPTIQIGDEGFVTVRYVREGDTWFDGNQYIPYKDTGVHFLKFVPIQTPNEDDVELVL